jgi:hypothetical protein
VSDGTPPELLRVLRSVDAPIDGVRSPARRQAMRSRLAGLAATVVVGLVACGADKGTDPLQMPWLEELIRQVQTAPVTNPPTVIYEYRYLGQTVYFVPARCCDIWSALYDDKGTLVCHPDGGLTGRGDGRCADFATARTDPRVIWRDTRQP